MTVIMTTNEPNRLEAITHTFRLR